MNYHGFDDVRVVMAVELTTAGILIIGRVRNRSNTVKNAVSKAPKVKKLVQRK